MNLKKNGFTLIEVLIALAIVSIALTALLRATAQTVALTARIKEKSIAHWVAMNAVTGIQLGLVDIHPNQEVTEVTKMFGSSWYWRAKLTSTPIASTQYIQISVSQNTNGPFHDPLLAFRYTP